MRCLGTLLLSAAVLFVAPEAHACPGCSNPNLPAARTTGADSVGAGRLSATLQLSATTMSIVHPEHCPEIGPICQERNEPPQLHDQRFYTAELRPVLELGLSNVWGLEAQIPVRLTRTTILFRRLDGTVFNPDYVSIHHRNETLAGFGDPWLSGRAAFSWGQTSLALRAGASLPIGSTVPNPFTLGAQGQVHQHVQLGAGTVGAVLAADIARSVGTFRFSGYGQSHLFFAENRFGYRPGHRFLTGVQADWTAPIKLRVGLGADVLNEQPERWDGVIQQEGNVGRTDVLLGASLAYPFGGTQVSVSVKTPVWQHFIQPAHTHGSGPTQLTYPAILNVSVQRDFRVF